MSKKSPNEYSGDIPEQAFQDALDSVAKYGRDEKSCQAKSDETQTAEESLSEDLASIELGEEANDFEDIEQLRAELRRAQAEAKKTHEKMLRIAADADNLRKRSVKEQQEARKYGQENLLRDLLPVIDNLERTLSHLPQDTQDPALDTLRQGVDMVLRQFVNVLSCYNVIGFESVGESFDPTKHEAINQEFTEEVEPGKIVTEMQKGYLLHDRLLRPALVTVAAKPNQSADPKAGERDNIAEQIDNEEEQES